MNCGRGTSRRALSMGAIYDGGAAPNSNKWIIKQPRGTPRRAPTMNKLTLQDIQNILDYERSRKPFRENIIALKKHRRVSIGDSITLVFENRDTVQFQIQEMARVERLVEDAQIQAELDVYNKLIPGENELSATLMVDISDQSKIAATLDSLVGLHRMVFLEIGDERVAAHFDPSQFEEDRISAVQYVTFPMTAAQREKFCDMSVKAGVVIGHPRYMQAVEFTPSIRSALIQDLL